MVRKLILPALALSAVGLYVGCSKDSDPPAPSAAVAPQVKGAATASKDEDHAHKPGDHGGVIVPIGRDNYHAEAVFEKGGKLRLFILGRDEAKVQEVELQDITAQVRPEGEDTDPSPLVLKPEPQPGDSEGKTSHFAGQLPPPLRGRKVFVTATVRIGGDRFRFPFESASATHDGMPAPLSAAEEETLYLTPGGKYTEADIKANGNMTASQKFKGLRSSHNARTIPGDKICPISETRANPKFTWVVGGKTYEFCCPPCVDEFVKLAKEQPDQIKEPEQYVKK
jgi:hypothetical protein